MDPYPAHLRAELAKSWQAVADQFAADDTRKAINAIPDCYLTPEVVAQIAACLSAKCKALSPSQAEVAQNYLDDLHDDMKGFAA